MRCRLLAAAALSLAGVTAADAADIYVAPGAATGVPHSVYVAPGGTYVAGPVYVTPAPAYVPPPIPPRPAYAAPAAVYAPPAHVHVERQPTYIVRERAIVAPPVYAREIVPRPPAAVPYHRPERCIVDLGHGRWDYCD
jgi:hypothetical protein